MKQPVFLDHHFQPTHTISPVASPSISIKINDVANQKK